MWIAHFTPTALPDTGSTSETCPTTTVPKLSAAAQKAAATPGKEEKAAKAEADMKAAQEAMEREARIKKELEDQANGGYDTPESPASEGEKDQGI